MTRMDLNDDLLRKLKKLNDMTYNHSFAEAVDNYGVKVVPEYNSLVTFNEDGIEVWATDWNTDKVLVFDSEEGWEIISRACWIDRIWRLHLSDYSEDSKLILIRTIPVLKDYTPEIRNSSNKNISFFIWRDGVNEYAALAKTPLEARYLISKELEYYPEILSSVPENYKNPKAFISMGDP